MGFAKMQIFGRGFFAVSADPIGKTAMVFAPRAMVPEAAPAASKDRLLKSPLEFKLSSSCSTAQGAKDRSINSWDRLLACRIGNDRLEAYPTLI